MISKFKSRYFQVFNPNSCPDWGYSRLMRISTV